ncbi:MAG TPA: PRC-barrel domain-containing protein [Thermoanaerobaculia bacterium]
MATTTTAVTALSAKALIGARVVNLKNENLGKIEDLVIEPEDGRVTFGILSFGGFLGMGEKLFAVPLQMMRTSTEDRTFVLDVDKEKLKNAPSFDNDRWPDLHDRAFGSRVYSYYGYPPYWR